MTFMLVQRRHRRSMEMVGAETLDLVTHVLDTSRENVGGSIQRSISRPARLFLEVEDCSWTIIVVVVFHTASIPGYVSDPIHSLLSPC
jgi:hypothetical protein